MKISEAHLGLTVGLGLWTLSALVMVGLFWTVAGDSLVARSLGVAWSTFLTLAQVLLWRAGGWRRWITGGLEILVLFSASAMAWSRLEAAHSVSKEAALNRLKASTEYSSLSGSLKAAEDLEATLGRRLANLPADFSSAAKQTTADLVAAGALARGLSAKIVVLEANNTETDGPTGIFSAMFGSGSGLLEFAVVLLLATLTEAAALALVSADKPYRGDVAPCASDLPTTTDLVPRVFAAGAVTAEEYLEAAKRLGDGKTLAGYRVVAASLGLGERRARELIGELIASGRVKDPRRPTEVSASAASFSVGRSPAAEG